jgi:hypothetical protein
MIQIDRSPVFTAKNLDAATMQVNDTAGLVTGRLY